MIGFSLCSLCCSYPCTCIATLSGVGYPPGGVTLHSSAPDPKTQMPDLTGKHFDEGKAPIALIPRAALEAEALVFAYGAKKYGMKNYQGGMEWMKLLNSALRHLIAFTDGENTDKESGLSHLGHARANLGMVLYYVNKNIGKDDR